MPELYDVLDFKTNWNHKLDCDAYTTFRLHNVGRYYVGKRFAVQINYVPHHTAQVQQVKTLTLAQACLSEFVTYMDTGYGPDSFRKLVETMYKNKVDVNTALFDLVLLLKLKPPKPNDDAQLLLPIL